jgi:ubiquinone/menaquinone biosynthesis C-methylase UbiE
MGSMADDRGGQRSSEAAAMTRGLVMNWGWRYDLLVWLADVVVLGGKLHDLRRRACELAAIQEGASLLDVGCGTGSLALEAFRRAGSAGHVAGVDPGVRQIARARSKARRAGFPIEFQVGVIERLGFADASFDIVLSTMMLHHLPDDLKHRGLSEVARVLRPGGRLVVGDFMRPAEHDGRRPGLGAGETGIQDVPDLIREAGFEVVVHEDMRFPWLPRVPGAGFVVGRKA